MSRQGKIFDAADGAGLSAVSMANRSMRGGEDVIFCQENRATMKAPG